MKIIYICFFSLLLFFISPAYSQNSKKAKDKKESEEVIPFYQGTYVSIDVFNPISHFLGTRFIQGEASVDVNLKNMFFPVFEFGYGGVDYSNDSGLSYKSSAPYFRIGVNYNTMAKKKRENHFYIGARYGMSSFKYDIVSNGLVDEIWQTPIEFNRIGMKSFAHWIELVAGVRVQIVNNFMMGWSVRMGRLISSQGHGDNEPWYIPGYGYSSTSSFGATYTLTYKFDIKKLKK